MTSTDKTTSGMSESVVAKLSVLDRFLAAWILLAMAIGLGLGRLFPGLNGALAALEVGGISLCPSRSACWSRVSGPGQGPLRPSRHRHETPRLPSPPWWSIGSSVRQ